MMTTRDEIPVVAAVIRRDGAVLLAKRPPGGRHGGRWEFPGGKIRDGETRADAVRRELREELGVETTSVGDSLCEVKDPGSPFLILFLPAEIEGEPLPLEHLDLRWCHQEDLLEMSLSPADSYFAREVLLPGMGRFAR